MLSHSARLFPSEFMYRAQLLSNKMTPLSSISAHRNLPSPAHSFDLDFNSIRQGGVRLHWTPMRHLPQNLLDSLGRSQSRGLYSMKLVSSDGSSRTAISFQVKIGIPINCLYTALTAKYLMAKVQPRVNASKQKFQRFTVQHVSRQKSSCSSIFTISNYLPRDTLCFLHVIWKWIGNFHKGPNCSLGPKMKELYVELLTIRLTIIWNFSQKMKPFRDLKIV